MEILMFEGTFYLNPKFKELQEDSRLKGLKVASTLIDISSCCS